MKSIKSVGFELEIFLAKKGSKNRIIENAENELTNLLGFNINPSYSDHYKSAILNIGGDFTLSTDGTPVEFSCFLDIDNEKPWNGYGLTNLIDTQLYYIGRISNRLLKDYDLSWSACHESLDGLSFNNAGYSYASNKTIYNAYTNQFMVQDQKEEDKEVTRRTAGLHIHLELNDKNITDTNDRSRLNRVVRKLDEIYYLDFFNDKCQSDNYRRRDDLTPKGWYRVKKQGNGVVTLEYRQPTTEMFRNKTVLDFLNEADLEIAKIIC